ncbi:zinc ribbon domain-containing protein [Geobacter sp.]|uniref:FmdB family zinc ribbon protein n=1 Tax=Geobacter sp. TaxID=46610 RepID=UPI0026312616|nr:zinc ribbon domain-containing protein [Geobacter sp.]
MPIYEYLCEACGENFSRLQKMGAGEADTVCPKCGSREVRKRISACTVGSGASAGPSCSVGGG